MATICFGLWTSHGPTLNTTPEQWLARLPADHAARHWWRGETFTFEELRERRRREDFAARCTLEERARRHAACQAAIARVAALWRDSAPDVCVIFGNDQRELFLEDNQPAFAVYYGDAFFNLPTPPDVEARMNPGIAEAEWAYRPEERTEYPGIPDLARIVFDTAAEDGFDLSAVKRWPHHDNHRHVGTPHAFSYVLRRVMNDAAIPTLPVFTNTFFPPNQPSAPRCFDFGRMIARAIGRWNSDARVAVVGSGGMSHFAIDEELDRTVLGAIQSRDARALTAIPQNILMSGTSELRNWIAAAGALFDTGLSGDVVDYIPCYRSDAGTGTANGFICWR